VNEPKASVPVVPLRVTIDPSNDTEIPFEAAKPDPDTITVELTVPLPGVRVAKGVIEKVSEPVCKLASVKTTV